MATDASHTLVVYGPGARADDALRELADSRVTVLSLVAQESEEAGCCDTRSVLWNEISRDLGREALTQARLALEGREAVRMEVVHFSGLARRRLRRLSPVPVRHAA